jgi:hypothetical protein
MRLSRQVDTHRRNETIQVLRITRKRPTCPVHGDRLELVMLRTSVADACSRAGVQTKHLPVIGKTFQELVRMASHNERGWNTLIAALAEKITI